MAVAGPRPRRPPLPSPGVRFAPDFVRRLERLVASVAAARERREGSGRVGLFGAGEEFVGYRPYRPGEDPRRLDWSLYARLDRPYVRVTRRESSERWLVALDASASMAVGVPGKLQASAELACALAAVASDRGARVRVVASGPGRPSVELRGRRDLPALMGFLEGRRAQGDEGLAALVRERRRLAAAGRVVLIGDLFDVAPEDLRGLRAPGRELALVRVLAPVELAPAAGERAAVEWCDPEGSERALAVLDPGTLADYERALERELEAWAAYAARQGLSYGCFSSDRPFEDVVAAVLAEA